MLQKLSRSFQQKKESENERERELKGRGGYLSCFLPVPQSYLLQATERERERKRERAFFYASFNSFPSAVFCSEETKGDAKKSWEGNRFSLCLMGLKKAERERCAARGKQGLHTNKICQFGGGEQAWFFNFSIPNPTNPTVFSVSFLFPSAPPPLPSGGEGG